MPNSKIAIYREEARPRLSLYVNFLCFRYSKLLLYIIVATISYSDNSQGNSKK